MSEEVKGKGNCDTNVIANLDNGLTIIFFPVRFSDEKWQYLKRYKLQNLKNEVPNPHLENVDKEFPGSLVVMIWHSHCYGSGSVCGLGTEISYQVNKKKERKSGRKEEKERKCRAMALFCSGQGRLHNHLKDPI